MSIGIEPLGEMVLIELEQAAEKTASGLMLPEAAREKMNVGTVVAAGPESENVKAGDTLVILEAMKMEHSIKASEDGKVTELYISINDQVENGALLMVVK